MELVHTLYVSSFMKRHHLLQGWTKAVNSTQKPPMLLELFKRVSSCVVFFLCFFFLNLFLVRMKSAGSPKAAEAQVLYAPKAICYVSQLPLFAFFKRYLAEIFMICQPSSHSWNIPLEKFISQIVCPIPVFFPPGIVFIHFFCSSFIFFKVSLICVTN